MEQNGSCRKNNLTSETNTKKKTCRTWLLPRHTQHGTKAGPEKASAQWRARLFSILAEGRTEGVTVRSKQTKTHIVGMVSSFVGILFWKKMLSTKFHLIQCIFKQEMTFKCLVVFGNTWVIHIQAFHVSSKKLAAYDPAMALGLEVSPGKAPWPQVSGLKVSGWHQWAVFVCIGKLDTPTYTMVMFTIFGFHVRLWAFDICSHKNIELNLACAAGPPWTKLFSYSIGISCLSCACQLSIFAIVLYPSACCCENCNFQVKVQGSNFIAAMVSFGELLTPIGGPKYFWNWHHICQGIKI